MTRKRMSKEEKQQRHEWAMKQIDKGVGFSELANRFAIGGVNFAENLKCIAGQAEMTYEKYCSRTQGIVCTKVRGWS